MEWRGLSVCLSVTIVSRAKTTEPIKMPFGLWTRVGPRKHVLDRDAHWRQPANTIELSVCWRAIKKLLALSLTRVQWQCGLLSNYSDNSLRCCHGAFCTEMIVCWVWLTGLIGCRELQSLEKLTLKQQRRSRTRLHRWRASDLCLRIFPTLSLFLTTSPSIHQVAVYSSLINFCVLYFVIEFVLN